MTVAGSEMLAMGLDGTCRTVLIGGGTHPSPEIQKSVGEKAHNLFEDVRTIQDALNQVPPDKGGPSPELKVDGLAYGKTVAAIRKFQKEACGFKWPDGRIDPNGRTHLRLKEFFIPANPYAVPMVYAQLPVAWSWIMSARRALDEARRHLSGGGFATSPAGYKLIDKYFHIATRPSKNQQFADLAFIDGVLRQMGTCIERSTALTSPGSGYFQEDPKENRHLAYTYPGGFTLNVGGKPPLSKPGYTGPVNRQDSILICSRNVGSKGLEVVAYIVVHELAHFCGPQRGAGHIDDFSYRRKGAVFFQLSPDLARRTADCYAQFAAESALKREPPVYWV